jgi:hypothetical protein
MKKEFPSKDPWYTKHLKVNYKKKERKFHSDFAKVIFLLNEPFLKYLTHDF